jgi:triphosphatase
MDEIELKFQVPAAARKALDRAIAGRAPRGRTLPPRVRLQATYLDTADRALAAARVALRMRREGRVWVQTAKAATANGMTRLEHDVPLPPGPAQPVPAVDTGRHAGTPVGERLAQALDGQPLVERYRTDILRRTRLQRMASGTVELACDVGAITAGDSCLPVCELEIECKCGAPQAVLEAARRWVPRFGLWLDLRSKSERGDLLARGKTIAPAAREGPPLDWAEAAQGARAAKRRHRRERPAARRRVRDAAAHSRHATPPARPLDAAEALRRAIAHCADPIVRNASQIASGEYADEHLHQLRVALRRLRSVLSLFDDGTVGGAATALAEPATTLFRRLGTARDATVVDAGFGVELRAAFDAAGIGGGAPVAATDADRRAPVDAVRATASQLFLLDLLGAALPPPAPAPSRPGIAIGAGCRSDLPAAEPAATDADHDLPPLRDRLAARIDRWHRSAAKASKAYDALDDEARHRLRRRIKRLRYAVELVAGMYPPRAVRRYLARLRAAQERLGAVNDAAVAIDAYARVREADPRAWFAIGWLAERRTRLVAAAADDMQAFAAAKRFWKER